MKVYNGKSLIAEQINDCKGWKSMIGLRFRKSFKPFDAFLIHLLNDSILDTFFVPFPFLAVWLDEDFKVLKVEECLPYNFYKPVLGQELVLELPLSKKSLVKVGDVLNFQTL